MNTLPKAIYYKTREFVYEHRSNHADGYYRTYALEQGESVHLECGVCSSRSNVQEISVTCEELYGGYIEELKDESSDEVLEDRYIIEGKTLVTYLCSSKCVKIFAISPLL
jgi:hypothetical protein